MEVGEWEGQGLGASGVCLAGVSASGWAGVDVVGEGGYVRTKVG